MLGEDWINVDNKHDREEIKNEYRYVFDVIFEERDDTSRLQFWSDNYEYVNAYQDVVLDLTPTKEYVFICPVRDRQSRKIKFYFVTQEYNVTSFPMYANPIAGRFIFDFDEQGADVEVQLRAMAEESAVGSEFSRRSHLAEVNYIRTRLNDYPSMYSRLYGELSKKFSSIWTT